MDNSDDWFNDVDDAVIEIINPKEILRTDNEVCEIELQEQCIYIEDILKIEVPKLTSNEIIQYECSITYFIQVLLEGSNTNKLKSFKTHDCVGCDLSLDKMNDIISYLRWISTASAVLAKRINQTPLAYNFDAKPSIIRSSYNFCTRYTQCKNFYSKHEEPSCKEHHYVHAILKYDIDSIIAFLSYLSENNKQISVDEYNSLYLSIKTICFVTRHMAKEISYINYITKNNSEAFHRNNPIDVTKRLPKTQRSNVDKKPVIQKMTRKNTSEDCLAKPNNDKNKFSLLSGC